MKRFKMLSTLGDVGREDNLDNTTIIKSGCKKQGQSLYINSEKSLYQYLSQPLKKYKQMFSLKQFFFLYKGLNNLQILFTQKTLRLFQTAVYNFRQYFFIHNFNKTQLIDVMQEIIILLKWVYLLICFQIKKNTSQRLKFKFYKNMVNDITKYFYCNFCGYFKKQGSNLYLKSDLVVMLKQLKFFIFNIIKNSTFIKIKQDLICLKIQYLYKFIVLKQLRVFKPCNFNLKCKFNQNPVLDKIKQITYNSSQSRAQSKIFQIQYQQSQDRLSLIKKISKSLRKSNLFSLKIFWNEELLIYLHQVSNHFEIYQSSYSKVLNTFVRLIQYKMRLLGCQVNQQHAYQISNNLYEILYPGISDIVNNLLKTLKLKTLAEEGKVWIQHKISLKKQIKDNQEKRQKAAQQFNNQIRKEYKIQKETQLQRILFRYIKLYHTPASLINLKMQRDFQNSFSNYIQQSCQIYKGQIHLQDYMSTISVLLKEYFQNLSLRQKVNKIQLQEQYLNEIESQKISEVKCLGCLNFFYLNMNTYDELICNTPVKVYPTINKMKQYQVDIKDNICAMLNSGGGIIMFDFDKINQKIVPRGQFLTQRDKQQIQQKITSYFRKFYPRPEININYKISFVPIYENPILHHKKQKQNFNNKGYSPNININKKQINIIKGCYITRIKVWPSDGTITYFWFQNKKDSGEEKPEQIVLKYCSIFEHHSKLKALSFGEMKKLIKKKLNSHYIPQFISVQQKRLLQKPINLFGHQCVQAEGGVQIVQKSTKKQVIVYNDPMEGSSKKFIHGITKFQQKYPSMALLIARKSDLQNIRQKLIENGVDCQIEIRFSQHRLKPSNNSAIIYHGSNFETVYKLIVNDPRFRFSNGKPVMVISIMNFMRIQDFNQTNSIDMKQFLQYSSWLKLQFPYQNLKIYEYQVDFKRKEYYLMTGSKLSLLFMYFIMNHHGEKCIMRNPYNLDGNDKRQKKQRLRQMYPQNQLQNKQKQRVFYGKQQSCYRQIQFSQKQELTQGQLQILQLNIGQQPINQINYHIWTSLDLQNN